MSDERSLTALERRAVEGVFQLGDGYVLGNKFSDRTFAEFFRDFSVNIDDPRYFDQDGRGSKARRLRNFLKVEQPPLTGRVLAALLEFRLATIDEAPRPQDLQILQRAIQRLGGGESTAQPKGTLSFGEAELLLKVFRPEAIHRLPIDGALAQVLIDRMTEASRCIDQQAYLAAVILCGSVLEGMCLGVGTSTLEQSNRAYEAQYGKPAPKFYDWKLSEWLDVLARQERLSLNVVKFGHALRDFRNFVHPAEQIARRFAPDLHTARIGFHVVVAAADDLAKN